jgi:hypothetical protein
MLVCLVMQQQMLKELRQMAVSRVVQVGGMLLLC